MKILHFIMAAVVVISTSACGQKSEWSDLFNGQNLNNWDHHIGTPIKGYEDRAASATPDKVFQVRDLNGEKVIWISGDVNASLATKESYSNYHFQMEFRWADGIYGNRNSGLLYHSYGPFGTGLGTWMNSHELQLMTGNVGDSYRMGDTYCEIPVRADGDQFIFNPGGERKPFGEQGVKKIARKNKNAEKAAGQWNLIDLYCFDDVSVHVVNGETVMVNYKSGKYENGDVKPLTSGKIQFQSEGGEMFMRNLRIRKIDQIPSEVML
jgi:hypothetical protein